MKNTNFSRYLKLWVAALVLVCGVAFVGCKPGVDKPALPAGVEELSADSMLIGDWTSQFYENYIITTTSFEAVDTFKGSSPVVAEDTDSTGRIFIKYTSVPDWSKGQFEEPENKSGWSQSYGMWYPNDEDLIGKWYAIYYKKIGEDSFIFTGAFGTNEDHEEKAISDLKDAITEFTVDNGYFSPKTPSEFSRTVTE